MVVPQEVRVLAKERLETRREEPRLLSGMEPLDKAIGGFPEGSVIVVAGRPGSGNDIFAGQALYNAARSGRRVTYLTVDRPPEEVTGEMRSMNYDLDQLVVEQTWNFLNGFETRLRVSSGEFGSKVLLDMLRAVADSAKRGDWTCVDTLSRMTEFNGHKEISSFLDDILLQAREGRGLHFIVIVEDFHDSKTLAALAQASDGYIRFTLDPQKAEPAGTIRIEKLRYANAVRRTLNYQISEDGISIETATRIL